MTFSNRGGFSSRRGQGFDRQLFDAVCASCGTDCKVPFRPNGRKEVFCSKCFEQNGGDQRDGGFSNRYEKRDNVRTYFADKKMFSAVCDQCGDKCKLPFEPRGDKPVLCSNCFSGKNDERVVSKRESLDLSLIERKLDRIIELLEGNKSMGEVPLADGEKKIAKKKAVKKISK